MNGGREVSGRAWKGVVASWLCDSGGLARLVIIASECVLPWSRWDPLVLFP